MFRHFARLSLMLVALTVTAVPACLASSSSSAIPSPAVDNSIAAPTGQETAVLAGGCFWGVQAVFQHLKGVISATSGYSGGSANTAQYELVSTGETGHAESVKSFTIRRNSLTANCFESSSRWPTIPRN